MRTRDDAGATGEETVTRPTSVAWRSAPQAGDILGSGRTARADVYSVSVVATAGETAEQRYSDAIGRVQRLARARRVDGWFTSDHTHYVRVASYRP